MELGLEGQACLVTGASRGIGLATARMLCAEGADVLLIGRDSGRLEAAVSECGTAGAGRAQGVVLDVTESEAGERAVQECRKRFGSIGVLVNNAGTSFVRGLEDLTDEDWQSQWDLHVMASLRFMRAAAPAMAEAGGGRIVNVCSSSGKRPSLTNAAYSVSKAAQLMLSRVFADNYAGRGVLVNAVAPGPVASELWTGAGGLADQAAAAGDRDREVVLREAAAKVPIGRMGTEDEIARVVVFLCSAAASNVTGAAWSVDGGAVPFFI